MKRLYFLILAALFTVQVSIAQNIPGGMKYQAVARNLSGEVIANQKTSLKIDLFTVNPASKNSKTFYSETHDVTTDIMGLFTLVIGEGKVHNGLFKNVPWSTEDIWMQIAIKGPGEANFNTISSSRLLAVPYAFHAGTANLLTNNNSQKMEKSPGIPANTWSLFGNTRSTDADKFGTTDNADLVIVTNNLERIRITAEGNVNLARSLKVGANLTVDSNVNLNNVSGATINNGPFTVEKTSPTYLTGTLKVDGQTDLNSALNVNNGSKTLLTGELTVDKATDLNSTLNVDGITNLNNTLNVTNTSVTNLSGALNVTGVSNLNNALNVAGVTKMNGQVTISATLEPSEADINNYPLIVKGSRNGVSIQVQGAFPNRNENFITFWNGNGEARGRIEGFAAGGEPNRSAFIALVDDANGEDSNSTRSQDPNQPLPPTPTALQNINNNYSFGLLNSTLTLVQNVVKFVINLIACIAGIGVFGDCDDVAWSGIDMAIAAVQFAGYIAYNQLNPGVAYESGGADYAEWLQKLNKDEVLSFGDVVGVKGGVISKTFSDAERFMIVSHNPGVIGAMPSSDEESMYEKVAFLGQVPVTVVGKVQLEDYILPSGNGDGMAIAVSPNKMQAMDFKRIIGIAWSVSDSLKDFNYINTAVGIHANDLAATVEDMQSVINVMQETLRKLDPNYKPLFYEIGNRMNNRIAGYSTAPTLRETISNNISMGKYANSTEALKGIKQYVGTQGLDLKQFPYVAQLLEKPTLPEAQKALDHYTKLLATLEGMVADAKKQRHNN